MWLPTVKLAYRKVALVTLPEVLSAAGIEEPPILVGHSDGASIALIYAASHPVAGLALMGLGLSAAGVARPALAGITYTLKDLGTLGGGQSYGAAVNDSGQFIVASQLGVVVNGDWVTDPHGQRMMTFSNDDSDIVSPSVAINGSGHH